MTVPRQPSHPTLAVPPNSAEAEVGRPVRDGRWQPTRAGVVNSWAWADEQLLFADGWLALAGPNGSGKSLTASMLVTLLLDADSSQRALSVSGEATGTLLSRHTDRNDREDRTGTWWIEYGRRDANGLVDYLTTGLWLRSVGGALHRAFFVTPARVGAGLDLHHERVPVPVEKLAEQLATTHGQLFTSSSRLRPKAAAHLSVADEDQYRPHLLARLFAPLDDVQFEALVGVLRSLRSVRTAEAISPNDMSRVLTDALPALDGDRLVVVAEAMERISDLEEQLQRTLEETRLLARTDEFYRRYVNAVTAAEAAHLAKAVTVFDDQTRLAREAAHALERANARLAATRERRADLRTETADLEGQLDGVDTRLRDHAGAELPQLEKRLEGLREQRDRDADRARRERVTAGEVVDRAAEAAHTARDAQVHLTELGGELEATGTRWGADAALERLLGAGRALADVGIGQTSSIAVDEVGAVPLAWADMRQTQTRHVRDALHTHALAQRDEQAAAVELRRIEDDEDRLRQEAFAAAEARTASEQGVLDAITTWDADRAEIHAVPDMLTEPDDRLDPDRIADWLRGAWEDARDRIAVVDHQRAAAAADIAARQTAAAAAAATEARRRAEAEARETESWRVAIEQDAVQRRAQAQARRRLAHESHATAELAAHEVTTRARTGLSVGREAAAAAGRTWAEQVAAWRTGLVHLPADAVPLPDDPDELDPDAAYRDLERVYGEAMATLRGRVVAADRAVEDVRDAVHAVETELAVARRAAPVPPAPPWREGRRHAEGWPLWSLVDFHPGLSEPEADRLEGALLVAGLLDALVTPDGQVVAGDLTLTPDAPVAGGRTLADLLVIEEEPEVDGGRVQTVLSGVGVGGPAGEPSEGLLRNGILTAASPEGYRATFIGRTTRERARLEHVVVLENRHRAARADLDRAQEWRAGLDTEVLAAAAEREDFPAADELRHRRGAIVELRVAVEAAQRRTAELITAADTALREALADIGADEAALDVRVADAGERAAQAATAAADAVVAEDSAQSDLRAARTAAADAAALRDQAESAQRRADAERARFPSLGPLREALRTEDFADRALSGAQAATVAARDRHRSASGKVATALRAVHDAATLPDGAMLPTATEALDGFVSALNHLSRRVEAWIHAASRTGDLLRDAARAASDAARAERAARESEGDLQRIGLAVERLQAQITLVLQLHGAEYEELRAARHALVERIADAKAADDQQIAEWEDASRAAFGAEATLRELEPARTQAEQDRNARFHAMALLVTHGLADVPDGIPVDDVGRPANITAALTWSRRILAGRSGDADRVAALTNSRDRALSALENSARTVNGAIARFDQQVDIATITGTQWRRATLAAPNAAMGEDLRVAVEALRATRTRLESDLRDDVKATLKTSMFTQLRRDIQDRRELARDLVRQIRTTLAGVRTGVARVGVEVDWVVREDADARRMVELISAPPSDETFEQMYEVLRLRMEDSRGEAWADRVAHTFDYRSWHEWKISVTHASFGEEGTERFRPVSARSNPLKALSTGESRLATMLPLLAAAWSMYSGDGYRGPRLLSIDEIDAAFDEENLRQVLALLRSWDFDVLATTPTITPLIKREAGQVVVHQVVTTGRTRVTVPWLWQGSGEPRPLTLDLWSAGTDGP
ncbi:SbcC/MukB-like Walker B domain-containing protein [Frankia sp. QA3]|uniref:SbcC/MukB-like Walker B domain-containing protein n=1 Tax=Frankia sp. QA3 TaxID=710111 RepID=UPI000269C222|nr:SbcC/MukB-like Walker B domain-containing protein [Frankia sp. QA3]EIV92598.1 hypothetical protein FraQA3DRAFT_2185 [Frankia sp. QA3]